MNRVVGGDFATLGEFPYSVGIIPEVTSEGQPRLVFCSGALIAPNVVLTSACAAKQKMQAVLGCVDVNDENCEVIDVENVFVNPRFIEDTFYYDETEYSQEAFIEPNDVAVMILAQPSSLEPVALLQPNLNIEDGQAGKLVAWGATSTDNGQFFENAFNLRGKQKNIELETIDIDACLDQLEDTFTIVGGGALAVPVAIKEEVVCTLGDGGACSGDEGAPLVMTCDSDIDRDAVFGVFIQAAGCGNDGIPDLFTKTFTPENFRFIEDRVKEAGSEVTVIRDLDSYCKLPPTPFPTFSDVWNCEPRSFGTGDGCNCECGQPDPDCTQTDFVIGCEEGETCSDEGFCVDVSSPRNTQEVPEGWVCPPERFNDAVCDCGCGVADIDCPEVAFSKDCLLDEICVNARCIDNPELTIAPTPEDNIPDEWFCSLNNFNVKDGCDCGCGVSDPDCALEDQALFGCSEGQTCSSEGTCFVESENTGGADNNGSGNANDDNDNSEIIIVLSVLLVLTGIALVISVINQNRKRTSGEEEREASI